MIAWILIVAAVEIVAHPAWCESTIALPQDQPFYPGEKLIYVFSWNGIRAGQLVLKVSDMTSINDEPAYHFVMWIASNSFIDHFYRYRSRIESYADLNVSRSLLYKKKERAGKRKRNIEVLFDWEQAVTHYYRSGKKKKTLPLLSGVLDPLSVIYHLRLCDMTNRQIIETPVTDGKKNFIAKAAVLGRETLQLECGTFDTYLLEPETRAFGGIFEKSSENTLYLWISADERRIPVRIQSKVLIGSITIELISISNARQPGAH